MMPHISDEWTTKFGWLVSLVVGLATVVLLPAATSHSATSIPAATSLVHDDPVVLAAGDIASCDSGGDEATARLLDLGGTVLTLGDNAYPNGATADFSDCYDPTWGRHKERSRPVPGNHEYLTDEGAAYFNYFGAAAGDPDKGYYSFDLGSWHVVALNSNCGEIGGCEAGSPQEQWLRADLAAALAAHPEGCTLAYMHHPRFSSGSHGNSSRVEPLWQVLYDHGADVVLAGHDHTYERFAPQDPTGNLDTARGIRQFVVGTGGANHYTFDSIQPNSEARNDDTHGVLQLTLHEGTYDWRFVPEAGKTFTDTGRGTCHASPSVLAFAPVADARVEKADPDANFGAEPALEADADPAVESFLRFDVAGVAGAVTRATLRVHTTAARESATNDGPAIYLADNVGTEAKVTWNSRPARVGKAVADTEKLRSDAWIEFDVTSLVNNNDTYTFALVPTSTDGTDFYAREGVAPPHLALTVDLDILSNASGTLGDVPLASSSCPTTLQALVDAASPGAVVNVPPCIYRETVKIAKPLTLDGQGQAEIRGSDVWDTGWAEESGSWVQGTVPSFPPDGVCKTGTSRCQWPEQVFFDNTPLIQVASNPASGQFAVDNARRVVLADDPNGHVVEVTTRQQWIEGEAANVTIRAFRMKHAASPYTGAGSGAIWNGHGQYFWTVEDNVLSDAHGAVVYLGGIGHQLLSNDISGGGILGVKIAGADILVQGNHVHHNNTEDADPFWQAGGLKASKSDRITFDRNETDHNDGPGVWCDWDCDDWVISNNRVHHNSTNGAILYEVGRTGKIFGNVLWENGWGNATWLRGSAIVLANSSTTEVYGNTLAWNGDGIAVTSMDRDPNYNSIVGNSIHDNVIISVAGSTALGWAEGFDGVLFDHGSENRGADNTYWYDVPEGPDERYWWAQRLTHLAEFNTTPGEENGRYLSGEEKRQILAAAGMPTSPENH